MRKTDFGYAWQYLSQAVLALVSDGTIHQRLDGTKQCLASFMPADDYFGLSAKRIKDRLACQDTLDREAALGLAKELLRLFSISVATSKDAMEYDEKEEYLKQFAAYQNAHEKVIELPADYALRMQNSLLPRWPESVLIDWFYRHNSCLSRYASLGYERFVFDLQTWPLSKIPTVEEAIGNDCLFQSLNDIPNDWLVKSMVASGTWSSPIILLENLERRDESSSRLNTPFHLLEGHRRLFYLNELRENAKDNHTVWVVTLDCKNRREE